MKFLEQHSQSSWFKSAIIMEEGDYNLHPGQVKGNESRLCIHSRM